MDLLLDILQAAGLATAAGILLASLLSPLPASVGPAAPVLAAAAGVLFGLQAGEWYASVTAAVCGALAAVAAQQLLTGMRARLAGSGAASTLPLYGVAIALLTAAITLVLQPVGVIVLIALVWFWIAARRRAGEKYEGLRILR